MKRKIYYQDGNEIRIGDKVLFPDKSFEGQPCSEAYVKFLLFPGTNYGKYYGSEKEECLVSFLDGAIFRFSVNEVRVKLIKRGIVDLSSIFINENTVSIGDIVRIDSKEEGMVEAIIKNPYVSMMYGAKDLPSLLVSSSSGDYSLIGINNHKIEKSSVDCNVQ